ncbi:hypothetical protein [Kutzneria albida]|uniref:hypothetical protein n=1 Tax=Kutzneria albida TaxID=43357 RepID=UPI00046CBED3|nr:hypothetical protein [Kutzneria albida]
MTAVEVDHIAQRWHEVKATFVDDPTLAVREADQLVEDLLRAWNERKRRLSDRLTTGSEPQTEQLRQVLRDYQRMVDALLPVEEEEPRTAHQHNRSRDEFSATDTVDPLD